MAELTRSGKTMRLLSCGCGSALLLLSCAPPPPLGVAPQSPLVELAGRTAGSPQPCVSREPGQALRVGDADTLLYGRGRTIWVNELGPSCSFSRGAALSVQQLGPRYCQGDLVQEIEPQALAPRTGCRLGNFVPYSR